MPVNTIFQDGDNSQLRKVIFQATPLAIEQTKEYAKKFKGNTDMDTCRNVFNFLRYRVTYKADGWHQKVKLPSALLRTRIGDCKSYSVFTYAILTNLGIPCKYVLTSYNADPTPSHIYVVTNSGIIIDAVWGKFNSEKKPTHKYIKQISDMKISTITGLQESPSIGCCDNKPKPIMGWYSDNKDKLGLNWKDKTTHLAALTTLAPVRGLIRKFIEANGGGIATSIFNNGMRKVAVEGKPSEEQFALIESQALKNLQARGGKKPTKTQLKEIAALTEVQIQVPKDGWSNDSVFNPNFDPPKSQMTPAQAWDKVLGGYGMLGRYQRYYVQFWNNKVSALKKRLTIPAATKSGIDKFNKVLVKWYQIGGDPNELIESINEGKAKTPRGKDANYMMMVAATRGLKFKDLGLIIRGFASGFGGEKFKWGSNGTYIFGQQKGIGEPATTAATITAYSKIVLAIMAVLKPLLSWIETEIAKSEAKKEMEKLEEDGFVLESDYLNMPVPRMKVSEVKQVIVPSSDAPELEDVASLIEEFEVAFSSNKDAADQTPPTKEEIEKRKKEGAFSPVVNQTIEESKTDKGTQAYLNLAAKTQKVIPKTGESVVRYVKLIEGSEGSVEDGENGKDPQKAGFGGIILPLLIGGGVLMALNTAKKQKK